MVLPQKEGCEGTCSICPMKLGMEIHYTVSANITYSNMSRISFQNIVEPGFTFCNSFVGCINTQSVFAQRWLLVTACCHRSVCPRTKSIENISTESSESWWVFVMNTWHAFNCLVDFFFLHLSKHTSACLSKWSWTWDQATTSFLLKSTLMTFFYYTNIFFYI